jgi:hypothetical protein
MSNNQTILDQISKYISGYDYGKGENGVRDIHGNGNLAIDCSHLVTRIIQGAGYDVG